MEQTGIRRFASEKTLFFFSSAIMLLMPAVEIVTEILCNYSKDILPSFFHPFLFGAFGVLGTAVAVIYKSLELSSPETRGRWYIEDLFYLVLIFFMILSAV